MMEKSRKSVIYDSFPSYIIYFLIDISGLPQNQRDISISDLRTCVANITQTRK